MPSGNTFTMDHYKPISCLFHDELESLATLKEDCVISFKDPSLNKKLITGKIRDISTSKGEEYLVMDSGFQIRLDHLISVNEIFLEDYKLIPGCIQGPK